MVPQQRAGDHQTLGQLWFLTGEDVYAKKAKVLLRRFMEVYPDIDGNDLTYDGTDWESISRCRPPCGKVPRSGT